MTLPRLLLVFLCCMSLTSYSQHLPTLEPNKEFENILVNKLYSDSSASTFIIWVRHSVKKHYHAWHTENLYIVEGRGTFIIGEDSFEVKPGDFFTIPPGTPHSFTTTSDKPVKALSVQSPEFLGEDRIFVED